MIEFLRRLFGQSGSSATAKERLRLVLMTDHLELAPELIEKMKADLVDVISRHVEVDRDHIEVNFERQDRALAMLANIPILSVNRPSNGNGSPPVEAAPAASATLPSPAVPQTAPAAEEPAPKKRAASAAANGAPRVRKRRRRSKKAAAANVAPAPTPS